MKKNLLFLVLILSLGFISYADDGSFVSSPVPAAYSVVGISQSSKPMARDLNFDDIKALIEEAVALAGGLNGIIKTGDTVVLKPNLVTRTDYCKPGWQGNLLSSEVNGNCTDHRVVKAVAQLVRAIIGPTGKIYVMEGSAQDTKQVMAALKYNKVNIPEVDEFLAIETDSGKWQDKKSPGIVKIDYRDGLYRKEYFLNKKIYEANALISLPTLKNHWHAVVTGCIKNIAIGSTPANIYGESRGNNGRGSMINHENDNFHKWIADFYSCRPADFAIMDALQGLENGPTPSYDQNGLNNISLSQKNMRCILASKDGLALDTVETNIINWDLDTVNYLKYLTQAGKVGKGNPKNIVVLGKKVDDIRSNFRGVYPPAGGKPLTDAQKAVPTLSIVSATFTEQALELRLNVSPNTDKVDVYIDGKYAGSATSSMNDVKINVDRINSGAHTVTVNSYTRYMYHAEASTTANK
jgi:uncharacterized protein (DUF362 family)